MCVDKIQVLGPPLPPPSCGQRIMRRRKALLSAPRLPPVALPRYPPSSDRPTITPDSALHMDSAIRESRTKRYHRLSVLFVLRMDPPHLRCRRLPRRRRLARRRRLVDTGGSGAVVCVEVRVGLARAAAGGAAVAEAAAEEDFADGAHVRFVDSGLVW